jgi:beta-lactamase superfamily II metal-dependent hydrolase
MPKYLNLDFAILYKEKSKTSEKLLTIVYGDEVEIIENLAQKWKHIRTTSTYFGVREGFVKVDLPLRDTPILKITMVDVQQGDGMVVETPAGKKIFIDGGDNKLFARHVAARFKHPANSDLQPLVVDAIIITHGDADHFDGLNEIRRSENYSGHLENKKLFIYPKRIFHNGIVKRPSNFSNKEQEKLGKSVKINNKWWITGLYDDTRQAPANEQNEPFKTWHESINHWQQRGAPILMKRIFHGQNSAVVFNFLHEEGISVDIQGPFQSMVPNGSNATVPALPFFGEPPKSSITQEEQDVSGGGSPSASHTINGHSVALRLRYKNFRMNLTGDLNRESMVALSENIPPEQLEAEIVKAPHHGSNDFDLNTLLAMKPVVALVSSGDESEAKEYIHPRASMMSALGKAMRERNGLVFCTELAAFFRTRDYSHTREDLADFFGQADNLNKNFTGKQLRDLFRLDTVPTPDMPPFFYGFERINFGLIHIRTDGERVLVFTHSGKAFVNEAYRFSINVQNGTRSVVFEPDVRTI